MERLRGAARREPNVRFVHGTAVRVLEEPIAAAGATRVVGLEYRPRGADSDKKEVEEGGSVTTKRLIAPLTILADGMWSGLRRSVSELKAEQVSTFVGLMIEHPEYATPLPHPYHGHVFLTRPSPMLMYQVIWRACHVGPPRPGLSSPQACMRGDRLTL